MSDNTYTSLTLTALATHTHTNTDTEHTLISKGSDHTHWQSRCYTQNTLCFAATKGEKSESTNTHSTTLKELSLCVQSTKRRGQKYEMILTSLHFLSVVFSVEDITQDSLLSRERERERERKRRERERRNHGRVWWAFYMSQILWSQKCCYSTDFFYLYSYRNIYYMWGEMLTNHKLLLC